MKNKEQQKHISYIFKIKKRVY